MRLHFPSALTLKRLLIRGLIALSAAAFLALAGFWCYDLAGQKEWEAWLAAEKARGAKLHPADFQPNVPPEQNFGALPLFERVLKVKEPERTLPLPIPSKPKPGFAEPWTRKRFNAEAWRDFFKDKSSKTKDAAPPADLHDVLSRYEQPLAELAGGIGRPAARFDGVETKGPFSDYAAREICQNAAVLFALRANVALKELRNDDAFADLKLIAGLRHQLQTEPCLIGELVRSTITGLMISVIYEGLERGSWSDVQLEEIGRELDAIDPLSGYHYALQTERALITDVGDYLLSLPDARPLGGPFDFLLKVFPGIVRRNQMRLHRYFEAWQSRIDLSTGTLNLDRRVEDEPGCSDGSLRNQYYALFNMMAPIGNSAETKIAVTAGKVQLVKTACALKRNRLAHGSYPETIEALIPQYLRAVPHELYSLEPIIYRPLNDGRYQLYFRGANRVDDGGRLTAQPLPESNPPRPPSNFKLLDWPWFVSRHPH